MGLEVKLLQDSLKAVSPKGDELVTAFYDELFKRYPQVKPLFADTNLDEQKAKLLRSIVLIVRNVEKSEFLVPYLEGLGRLHVAYGAQATHYDAVGECLLVALEKTAGPLWNSQLNKAWGDAYGTIADVMKKGAAGSNAAQAKAA